TPAASIAFTRFQHGVEVRPTAAASCCTVWRESRCSASRIAWSVRSRTIMLRFPCERRVHSPLNRKLDKERSTFSASTRKLPASAAPAGGPSMPQTLARPAYRLADNLAASVGVVFLTGTQALIRLALMQAARDTAAGVKSQGFISGYRGSPLGMVDQQAWKAKKLLDGAGVKFLPAINEELGATAVLGTQRVESDPERTADG